MSDQNTNPLDIDLSSVKTDRPLLAGGKMTLQVVKAELVVGTKNPNAKMLKSRTRDHGPATLGKRDTLNPGVRVFHRENYVQVGKLSASQILEGMGKIVQAAAMPSGTTIGTIEQWYKQLEGKLLKTRVILEPAKEQYAPKNAVADFYKA